MVLISILHLEMRPAWTWLHPFAFVTRAKNYIIISFISMESPKQDLESNQDYTLLQGAKLHLAHIRLIYKSSV